MSFHAMIPLFLSVLVFLISNTPRLVLNLTEVIIYNGCIFCILYFSTCRKRNSSGFNLAEETIYNVHFHFLTTSRHLNMPHNQFQKSKTFTSPDIGKKVYLLLLVWFSN